MEREIHSNGIHVKFIPPENWWKRAKWELLQDYTSANGHETAPTGTITDGASIPWFLRWRFSPTGKYFGAAIIHDYIIITEEDWDRANKEFDNELKALKVGKFDHAIMAGAVKIWAWYKKLFNLKPKEIQ